MYMCVSHVCHNKNNLTNFLYYLCMYVSVQIFRSRATPEAIEFISELLQYAPLKRLTAIDAMAHPFFDELRDPETRLSNGKALPRLFDFTAHGNKKEFIDFIHERLL